jgi:hypothetical protein
MNTSTLPAPNALGLVVCDDNCIYGAGMNEEDCLDNALECLCGFCEREALKMMLDLCQTGVRYPLRQIPASQACVAQCQATGPTAQYRIHDGVAYTLEELAEPLSA